jgi:hypothetical protein
MGAVPEVSVQSMCCGLTLSDMLCVAKKCRTEIQGVSSAGLGIKML